MNPYFRPTAAPAPAPGAYPTNSDPFQPTAASAGAVNHGQKTAPPQAVPPTYPPTRRAAPPHAHAAAAPAAAPPSSSKPPGPYPSGTGPPAGVGPVRTKKQPWDRSNFYAAERAVPLDLWHPAAGCVRYYPADRHKPKPAPVHHPTLSSEHRRLSTASAPKPNNVIHHPNCPPPSKGPTYLRPYNSYPSSPKSAPKPEPAPDADADEIYKRVAPWLRPGATCPVLPAPSHR